MSLQSFTARIRNRRAFNRARSVWAIVAICIATPTIIVSLSYLIWLGTILGHWLYGRTGYGIAPEVYSETGMTMSIGFFQLFVLYIGIFGQILILPAAVLNALTIELFVRHQGPAWLISIGSGFFFGALAGGLLAAQMLVDDAFIGATLYLGGLGALMGLYYCWLTGPQPGPAF
ncbi:MAG: hypothetical protein IPK59_14110 [Rhodospirillaceae bacterium]|nr:hypothetical protein [Rhodospirillaceae bacterium]